MAADSWFRKGRTNESKSDRKKGSKFDRISEIEGRRNSPRREEGLWEEGPERRTIHKGGEGPSPLPAPNLMLNPDLQLAFPPFLQNHKL